MSTKITCLFCKEEGHSRINENGDVTCPALLSHLCTYCKKTGHTNKHCPVAQAKSLAKQTKLKCTYCKQSGHRNSDCLAGKQANKDKKKREEHQKDHKIKQIAERTYAGLVMSSITPDEEQQIEREQHEMHQMLRKRREEQQKVKKEEWETNYPGRMEAYYGQYDSHRGSFWMFFVYGTKYDYKSITEPLRDAKSQANFLKYLETKYSDNWMTAVVSTKDFCPFVEKLIQTILEDKVKTTMETSSQIMENMRELKKTLTSEELEAHLGATNDEFMAELGPVESEWKKVGKKQLPGKKEVMSEI